MNQTLICSACGTTWARKAQRGRKPKFCPDCDPANQPAMTVKATNPNVEILECAAGHTWHRTKARGRKPPYCPEHRLGTAAAVIEDGETTRPKGLPSVVVRHPAVQEVLDGPRTELQRKLEYTVHELENPAAWREHGDWTLLIDVHKRLTQEAEKASLPITSYTPSVEETDQPKGNQ